MTASRNLPDTTGNIDWEREIKRLDEVLELGDEMLESWEADYQQRRPEQLLRMDVCRAMYSQWIRFCYLNNGLGKTAIELVDAHTEKCEQCADLVRDYAVKEQEWGSRVRDLLGGYRTDITPPGSDTDE